MLSFVFDWIEFFGILSKNPFPVGEGFSWLIAVPFLEIADRGSRYLLRPCCSFTQGKGL